jgi:hypothetical protein
VPSEFRRYRVRRPATVFRHDPIRLPARVLFVRGLAAQEHDHVGILID